MCEGCSVQPVVAPRTNERALARGFLAASKGQSKSNNPYFDDPSVCADALSTYGWWNYGWESFHNRLIPYDIWKELPDGMYEGPITVATRKLLAEKGELTLELRSVLHL